MSDIVAMYERRAARRAAGLGSVSVVGPLGPAGAGPFTAVAQPGTGICCACHKHGCSPQCPEWPGNNNCVDG